MNSLKDADFYATFPPALKKDEKMVILKGTQRPRKRFKRRYSNIHRRRGLQVLYGGICERTEECYKHL